jgi:hypothetical protein
MSNKKKNVSAGTAETAGTAGTATVTIERDKRRRARSEAIAKLGEDSHPFAAAAAAQNKKVIELENLLEKERSSLMTLLRVVR